MDFEPWWLIFIPVVFALGWLAARIDFRQMLRETRRLPDSYFKGLNFLLNEEPDRAIDAFVEVAKLDPETTELHFALGSLFRRRGEMERAIRVHQSLLSRADLPEVGREHAMHELAQDFLKGGMLDRAETAFEALKSSRFALPALRALVRIYESEHNWPRAIEAVKILQTMVGEPVPQIGHYHCELAQDALAAKPAPDIDAASAALDAADHAVEANAGDGARGVRARIAMLRARIARVTQDPKRERLFLETVLADAPGYAGLVAEALLQNYQQAGQAQAGLALLRAQYEQFPSLDLFNVVFRELRAQQGASIAWDFARQTLRVRPSLLGLDRLLEVEIKEQGDGADSHAVRPSGETPAGSEQSGAARTAIVPDGDIALLRSLIHKHTQRLDRYVCCACGFQPRKFYWQCPGCNAWETYAPRRLEEME